MKIVLIAAALISLAVPAGAVTVDNGIVLITQADATAGGVTPGDTAGFPITISVSGSYRLASNLAVLVAVNGIEVRAPEVTIDMAGFRIAGGGLGTNAIAGFFRALTVMNGTIRGFKNNGVHTIGNDLVVDNMRITDNGQNGVFADNSTSSTDSARITNSDISRNQYGVTCTKSCLIQNNTISGNTFTGFTIFQTGGIVLNNTVTGNAEAMFLDVFGVGVGNTTMLNNTNGVKSAGQDYIPMNPNACSPAC